MSLALIAKGAVEIIKVFIEGLRVVVWPAFFVWVIWYLRAEISRAATRITKLGPGGAEFSPPPAQIPPPDSGGVAGSLPSAETPRTSGEIPSALPAARAPVGAQQYVHSLKALYGAELLDPEVQAVRAQLPAAAGPDQKAQIDALAYTIAALNVQIAYERIYILIYGSQLNLLAQLNVDAGAPPSVAKDIYDRAKATWPDLYGSYAFEAWMGFLINTGLCAIGANGNYILTPKGRGFLQYLLQRHLPLVKPF